MGEEVGDIVEVKRCCKEWSKDNLIHASSAYAGAVKCAAERNMLGPARDACTTEEWLWLVSRRRLPKWLCGVTQHYRRVHCAIYHAEMVLKIPLAFPSLPVIPLVLYSGAELGLCQMMLSLPTS